MKGFDTGVHVSLLIKQLEEHLTNLSSQCKERIEIKETQLTNLNQLAIDQQLNPSAMQRKATLTIEISQLKLMLQQLIGNEEILQELKKLQQLNQHTQTKNENFQSQILSKLNTLHVDLDHIWHKLVSNDTNNNCQTGTTSNLSISYDEQFSQLSQISKLKTNINLNNSLNDTIPKQNSLYGSFDGTYSYLNDKFACTDVGSICNENNYNHNHNNYNNCNSNSGIVNYNNYYNYNYNYQMFDVASMSPGQYITAIDSINQVNLNPNPNLNQNSNINVKCQLQCWDADHDQSAMLSLHENNNNYDYNNGIYQQSQQQQQEQQQTAEKYLSKNKRKINSKLNPNAQEFQLTFDSVEIAQPIARQVVHGAAQTAHAAVSGSSIFVFERDGISGEVLTYDNGNDETNGDYNYKGINNCKYPLCFSYNVVELLEYRHQMQFSVNLNAYENEDIYNGINSNPFTNEILNQLGDSVNLNNHCWNQSNIWAMNNPSWKITLNKNQATEAQVLNNFKSLQQVMKKHNIKMDTVSDPTTVNTNNATTTGNNNNNNNNYDWRAKSKGYQENNIAHAVDDHDEKTKEEMKNMDIEQKCFALKTENEEQLQQQLLIQQQHDNESKEKRNTHCTLIFRDLEINLDEKMKRMIKHVHSGGKVGIDMNWENNKVNNDLNNNMYIASIFDSDNKMIEYIWQIDPLWNKLNLESRLKPGLGLLDQMCLKLKTRYNIELKQFNNISKMLIVNLFCNIIQNIINHVFTVHSQRLSQQNMATRRRRTTYINMPKKSKNSKLNVDVLFNVLEEITGDGNGFDRLISNLIKHNNGRVKSLIKKNMCHLTKINEMVDKADIVLKNKNKQMFKQNVQIQDAINQARNLKISQMQEKQKRETTHNSLTLENDTIINIKSFLHLNLVSNDTHNIFNQLYFEQFLQSMKHFGDKNNNSNNHNHNNSCSNDWLFDMIVHFLYKILYKKVILTFKKSNHTLFNKKIVKDMLYSCNGARDKNSGEKCFEIFCFKLFWFVLIYTVSIWDVLFEKMNDKNYMSSDTLNMSLTKMEALHDRAFVVRHVRKCLAALQFKLYSDKDIIALLFSK